MSLFVMLILILGIFDNEITCQTLGGNWKSRLNLKSLSENEVSTINGTNEFARDGKTTTTRQAKFLPKISIMAGLNIGGSSVPRIVTNLTPIARISQANSSPDLINPYFAATYDPYPSSAAMQQSIQALYRLVERLSLQMNNIDKNRDNSGVSNDETVTTVNVDDAIDDRRRHKDKIKSTKLVPKRKDHEKNMAEEDEETYEDVEEKPLAKMQKLSRPKNVAKNGARKNPSAKQANVPASNPSNDTNDSSMTTDTSSETNATVSTPTNATGTNSTTDQGNATYHDNSGYYYGGNPQSVGHVSLTYDKPQDSYDSPADNYGPPMSAYGTPSYSYGPPSHIYGPPSHSYGPPSQSYGPPSRVYGRPSQAYELAPHASFEDHEGFVYDDPTENSFGLSPSERWHQRLPFARSRDVVTTTRAPVIANVDNGFVPML